MAIRPLYPEKLQHGHPTVSDRVWTVGSKLNSFKRSVDVSTFFLQLGQSFRTNLWATTKLTEEATRNGSTPISNNRVTVLEASLVCRVLRTRCPVKAALMEISAVSLSRISPTMIISGSWRRKERNTLAKESPISS